MISLQVRMHRNLILDKKEYYWARHLCMFVIFKYNSGKYINIEPGPSDCIFVESCVYAALILFDFFALNFQRNVYPSLREN